ncbi:unnamed protein product [Mytilus coruscus]|uniref:Uncharacterized protein n=1 Tax=Mytilus coruscus TaxID=42192 RepID=A0A6J8AQK8_MYTCO|nr:unnamed protein product [Mytilus coruscus]
MDELMKASIKLDTTIETIKSDLVQLRNQDIKLMKQLIQISDTIQQISKRQMQQRPLFNAKGYLSQVLMFINPASLSVKIETPLIRQQSVPTYCRMNKLESASLSSIEDSDSLSTCDDSIRSSNSEYKYEDNTSIQRQLSVPESHRPKSISTIPSLCLDDITDCDQHVEEILMRNVRMWKRTQQNDDDSVFIEDYNLPTLYEK